MLRYWFDVLHRAIFSSFDAIGQSVGGIAFGIIAISLGWGIVWHRKGFGAIKADVLKSGLEIAVIAFLAWLPFFLWSLARTPYLISQEKSEAIRSLQGRLDAEAQANAANRPRFTISHLGVFPVSEQPKNEKLFIFGADLLNVGERTARGLGERFVMFTQTLDKSFAGDFVASPSSVDVDPNVSSAFRSSAFGFATEIPPVFIVFIVNYSDVTSGTAYRQIRYYKWGGVSKSGFLLNAFEDATLAEKEKIVPYCKERGLDVD